MNPCHGRKKSLTWLALDSLDASSAQELRAHLETCPGCRQYLAEMSQMAGQIASAAPTENLLSSEAFHRQLMTKINAEASAPVWKTFMDSLRTTFLYPRLILPATAVLVAMLTAVIWSRPHPAITVLAPPPVTAQPMAVATVDPAPTIANYQRVAGQSTEKLDDLLGREGRQASGPARVCTASTMSLDF